MKHIDPVRSATTSYPPRTLFIAVLALLMVVSAASGQEDTTGAATTATDASATGASTNGATATGSTATPASAAATAATTQPPRAPSFDVTLVLDGNDIRQLATIGEDLWDYSFTPEGAALLQALMNGADEDSIGSRFFDGLGRFISLRHPSNGAPREGTKVQIPLTVNVYVHRPTLEAVVKEIVDKIFVSRPWTGWGERHPVLSQRIRERMVYRSEVKGRGLYHRIVTRMISKFLPVYVAKAEREVEKFCAKLDMDPNQVNFHLNCNDVTGYLQVLMNGNSVLCVSSKTVIAALDAGIEKIKELWQKYLELKQKYEQQISQVKEGLGQGLQSLRDGLSGSAPAGTSGESGSSATSAGTAAPAGGATETTSADPAAATSPGSSD